MVAQKFFILTVYEFMIFVATSFKILSRKNELSDEIIVKFWTKKTKET